MIRDTFEANPGLCELFRRRILDRAQSAGLSRDMIDFESQIDMKGTFQDNLRTFYREYPQLTQDSDYLRLKSARRMSGAFLEQSWRNYESRNARTEQPVTATEIFPTLTVRYTVGCTPPPSQSETRGEQGAISKRPLAAQAEVNPTTPTHTELMRLLLDRVASVAGESATKTILHQIGREIGLTAFHHSRKHASVGDLDGSLDHALRVAGLGRVVNLEEINRHSSITYECSVGDCPLCRQKVGTNPTCGVLRGMITRWFEAHLQKKTEITAERCTNGERHLCVFRVMFRK